MVTTDKQQEEQTLTAGGRVSNVEMEILVADTESLQDCLNHERVTQLVVSATTPDKSFAQDIFHLIFSMRPISRRHGQQQRCTIHMLFLC
jgi:hypothetical protein